MSYTTLVEKLKRLEKKAKKNREIPREVLKEVCSYSPLYLLFDYDTYDKEKEELYVYDNVYKVFLMPPFNWEEDYIDEIVVRIKIQFINREEKIIYGSIPDLFRNKEIEKLWKENIFPELKEGDLVQTMSPTTFLIKDFKGVVCAGFDDADWDETVPEGTVLTVLDKIQIDDFYMTKVFYQRGIYWSIGYVAKDIHLVDFNPHYI